MKNHTTMIGLDIAKNVFEAVCQDEKGRMVERKRLMRSQVLPWFAEQSPSLVGVEACCGAHYWAREITKRGHTVRIIPPQHVKPFVRTNKSDTHDAQAICRALREPDMTFVSIADSGQQDVQALHRVRSLLIRERTALVNQMRGLLLEYGIALPKNIHQARSGIEKLIQKPPEMLSLMFRSILEDHYRELKHKDDKIDNYSAQIEKQVAEDPAAKRAMKIPGIGPLSASALVLKVRHEAAYKNGRHFAAAIGLVPRHDGTGGKIFIRGMSKRGDKYLRSLLIHGARAVVSHVERKTDTPSLWLKALAQRRGTNKAVVALANKNARVAWQLIAKEEDYNPALAFGPCAMAA